MWDLFIDKKLTIKSLISPSSKKAAAIYKQLAPAAMVTLGPNGEITRAIHVAVIKPFVLKHVRSFFSLV